MILDSIIDIIYRLFMNFLDGYKPLSLDIDITFFDTLTDFFAFIFYVLPIDGLKPIIGIILAIMGFRLVIVIFKTIWDVLPFV